jgi:hypothetical protein
MVVVEAVGAQPRVQFLLDVRMVTSSQSSAMSMTLLLGIAMFAMPDSSLE